MLPQQNFSANIISNHQTKATKLHYMTILPWVQKARHLVVLLFNHDIYHHAKSKLLHYNLPSLPTRSTTFTRHTINM